MNTFRDKHFKNKLDPKAAYYECIRSCEINKSTEKGVKNCILKCNFLLFSLLIYFTNPNSYIISCFRI